MFPILPDGEKDVNHNTMGKDKINPQKVLKKLLEILN